MVYYNLKSQKSPYVYQKNSLKQVEINVIIIKKINDGVVFVMLIKTEKGFLLDSEKTSFEFESNIIPKLKDNLFKTEVKGNVPVPKIKKGDRLLLPVDDGIAITAEKEYVMSGKPLNCIQGAFLSRAGTMSMVVIERDKKFLLIALDNGIGASYKAEKTDGLFALEIICERACNVSYGIFDSLTLACKCYRNIKKCGQLTLEDKLKNNPEIDKLIGGGIFWVWSDNYDKVMYSHENTDLAPGIGDKLFGVADELYESGIRKAMFGFLFESDSYLTEKLYKKYGYLATQYDNYNDVLNPELLEIVPSNRARNCDYTKRRMKDYPDGVQIRKDGTLAPAWQLKGFDGNMYEQNTLCPLVAAKRIKEEIPEILKNYPYYKGRFIDVYGTSVAECFSKEHPVTFDECLELKKDAFKFLGDIGLIAGTEDGMEEVVDSLVYTEGLHSPVYFRAPDSGRIYPHTFTEEQTEHINKQMLNPECRVPLWHLVYHENMIVFPYWGDSTEMSPELIAKKVLFACLYGCAPIYSFLEKEFCSLKEVIVSSYKKITDVTSKTATLPMSSFEILSEDYSVQKSVFGDKYEVVANFSEKEYVYNNKKIMPNDLYFGEL